MKLKNVQAYHLKDVPDHITHECVVLGQQICIELKDLLKNHDPNIVFGAITFFHAAMIKTLISDNPEQQQQAAKLAAIGLIKNVNFLNGIEDANVF